MAGRYENLSEGKKSCLGIRKLVWQVREPVYEVREPVYEVKEPVCS